MTGGQGVGVLGTLDPLAEGQQGGVQVTGPGRIPRPPRPAGEFVPGVQGVSVLTGQVSAVARELAGRAGPGN